MGRKGGQRPVAECSKRSRVGSRELNNLLQNSATRRQDHGFPVATSATLITGTMPAASILRMTNNTSSPAVTNPSSCAVNSSVIIGSHTTGAVRSVGANLPGFCQTSVLETVPVSSPMTNPLSYAGNPSSASGIINPPGHVVNLPSVVSSSQAASTVWSISCIFRHRVWKKAEIILCSKRCIEHSSCSSELSYIDFQN